MMMFVEYKVRQKFMGVIFMEKNKAVKISDEDVRKVSGGMKVKGHVKDPDDYDEEALERLLDFSGVSLDKVAVTSEYSFRIDPDEAVSFDEMNLDLHIKMPFDMFKAIPYFEEFGEKMDHYVLQD